MTEGSDPQISERESEARPIGAGGTAGRREFEQLLTPLLDSLYGAALRMTRDPSDAEDLVQDTVVKAYRFYDRFQPGTNFRAWLLRVMTNLYINQYRKEERQGEQVDLDDEEDVWIWAKAWEQAGSNTAYDPEKNVLARLGTETICAAINALPAEFRVVVTLADVEELTYEEIAQALEIPVGTVKSRLYRGRKRCQRLLWEYIQEGFAA
jgi:RNA polymerase sigma-70 factor (ECF subfamily)